MKKYFLLALAAAATGVAYVVARSRQAPPQPAGATFEPAPRPAVTSPSQAAELGDSVEQDDLTEINGIGVVYAARLGDLGIDRFESLAGADADDLGAKLGVSARTVKAWQAQADALAG